MKKVLFHSFYNDFDRFRPCERMRKHAFAGRNTQQEMTNLILEAIPKTKGEEAQKKACHLAAKVSLKKDHLP